MIPMLASSLRVYVRLLKDGRACAQVFAYCSATSTVTLTIEAKPNKINFISSGLYIEIEQMCY